MRISNLIIYLLIIIITACQKHPLGDSCDNLKKAIINDDTPLAKSAVDNIIAALPNSNYSQANLQSLTDRLTTNCNLPTQVLCYSCIKTQPPQSEIRISADSTSGAKERLLDISYTTTNRMTCLNMHE